MKKRPLSVTITCILILLLTIAVGLLNLKSIIDGDADMPILAEILQHAIFGQYGYYTLCVIDIILCSVCSIMMLYGKNWARITYIVYAAIAVFIDPIVLSQGKVIQTKDIDNLVLMFGTLQGIFIFTLNFIIIAILVAPKAQSYFTNTEVMPSNVKRPVLLSILCWLMLSLGLLSASTLFFHNTPLLREQFAQQNFILTVILAILPVVAIMAMLYAKKWGRVLYVAYFIICMLMNLESFSNKSILVLQLIGFAITLFILFSKKANAYFRGEARQVSVA